MIDNLDELIKLWFAEDIGDGDHTTLSCIPETAMGKSQLIIKEKGILAGANVVMPNLSPASVRKKYMLYNNKVSDGVESAQSVAALAERMRIIGYRVVTDRGDIRK